MSNISKRVTAQSMTAELFQQRPAPEPTPPVESTPTSEQIVAPQAVEPPREAPPVDPPSGDPPRQFSPVSIKDRFSQPPPAPVVEKKVEEVPEVPPEVAHPDQKTYTWAKLRTDLKEAERRAADAQREAEQAKLDAKKRSEEQAAVAAELEEARRREQELTERVGRLSLSESPEFQRKYDLKFSELKTKLGGALNRYAGVNEQDVPATVEKLMSASPKELPEMLADLSPSVAGMVLNLVSEAATIDEAKKQELANWRQTGAAASVLSARQTAVEAAETRRRLSAEAIEVAKAYGNPVFAATDPDAKSVADAIATEFHGFVQAATEEQLIRAAAEGFAAPYLYEVMERMQQENMQLREQLNGRVRVMNPPVFPVSPSTPAPSIPLPPANVVPVQQVGSARDYARETAASALVALGFPR